MTKPPDVLQPTPIPSFTEAQLKAPWRVVHAEATLDPEIVKTYIQEIVGLTQHLFSPEVAVRGNAYKTSTQMSIHDHSPLEKPGDEPKRRLWDIEHTYGDDGTLEVLELRVGGQLQQIRIRPKIGEISYFGHHYNEVSTMVESEKINHPLWVEYTRRKVRELVAEATRTRPSAQAALQAPQPAATIDDHPIQTSWHGNPQTGS